MTARFSELNSPACACLRNRPILDAANLLVVSICVVCVRIIGLFA